jgi:hypothetical protein
MRCEEVACGVVAVLDPLEGDVDDAAPLVSLEVLDAPLVLLPLVDAPLAPDMPLGDVLLGDVLLEASAGVVLPDVLLPDVLEPLLDAGWLRLTSPPDVPVTVLLGDALLTGTQSAGVVAELEVPAVVEEDMPLDVLGLVTLPLADAEAPSLVESADVDGVVPVPLAPFVVFGPVKR